MLGQMNFFEAIQTAFSIQNFGAVPCGTHMCPLVNTFPPPSLVWCHEQWSSGGESVGEGWDKKTWDIKAVI